MIADETVALTADAGCLVPCHLHFTFALVLPPSLAIPTSRFASGMADNCIDRLRRLRCRPSLWP